MYKGGGSDIFDYCGCMVISQAHSSGNASSLKKTCAPKKLKKVSNRLVRLVLCCTPWWCYTGVPGREQTPRKHPWRPV